MGKQLKNDLFMRSKQLISLVHIGWRAFCPPGLFFWSKKRGRNFLAVATTFSLVVVFARVLEPKHAEEHRHYWRELLGKTL